MQTGVTGAGLGGVWASRPGSPSSVLAVYWAQLAVLLAFPFAAVAAWVSIPLSRKVWGIGPDVSLMQNM